MRVGLCLRATLFFACLIWLMNESNAQPLRIGAWNLMFFSATPFANVSHIKEREVRRSATDIRLAQDIVRRIDADIFALQEVNSISALDHFSSDYHVYMAPRVEESDDLNMVQNAIMVRRSLEKNIRRMFTVEGSRIEYWERSGDNLERRVTRPFVGAEIESGNESRIFLSVHFKAGGCVDGNIKKRQKTCAIYRKQARVLNEFLRASLSARSRTKEVWVLGDFNRELQVPNVGDHTVEFFSQGITGIHHSLFPKYMRTGCQTTRRSMRKGIKDRTFIDYLVCFGKSESSCNATEFSESLYDEEALRWNVVFSDHCPISARIH